MQQRICVWPRTDRTMMIRASKTVKLRNPVNRNCDAWERSVTRNFDRVLTYRSPAAGVDLVKTKGSLEQHRPSRQSWSLADLGDANRRRRADSGALPFFIYTSGINRPRAAARRLSCECVSSGPEKGTVAWILHILQQHIISQYYSLRRWPRSKWYVE